MRLSGSLQCGFIKTGTQVRVTCTNTFAKGKEYIPAMQYIAVLDFENAFGFTCYSRENYSEKQYQPNFDNIKAKVNLFDADGVLVENHENYERSLRRARVAVVDYALTNHFEYFGTITFNDKWHDVSNTSACLHAVLDSFNNYQQRYNKSFQYILVGEFGEKTGRLHFHFLISGINKEDLFINKEGWLDWNYTTTRFGHTQITRIRDRKEDHENVARYCSKYITKQNIRISSHRYYASKTLKKPEVSRIYDPVMTAFVSQWIQENCFEPYIDTRMCTCFSLPERVYNDLLQAVEEWKNTQIEDIQRRVLLFHVPDNIKSPFDEVQLCVEM